MRGCGTIKRLCDFLSYEEKKKVPSRHFLIRESWVRTDIRENNEKIIPGDHVRHLYNDTTTTNKNIIIIIIKNCINGKVIVALEYYHHTPFITFLSPCRLISRLCQPCMSYPRLTSHLQILLIWVHRERRRKKEGQRKKKQVELLNIPSNQSSLTSKCMMIKWFQRSKGKELCSR